MPGSRHRICFGNSFYDEFGITYYTASVRGRNRFGPFLTTATVHRDGNGETEDSAVRGIALQPYFPAMRPDDIETYREAQTHRRLVRRREWLEQPRGRGR